MRPLYLRIAGLNSFREVQEIDFSRLCETGVFGIFGTTGSGKSTILDAITLALYGTVERAANNTQGILNYAEEQLTVEYTFALSIGEQRKVYQAERAYRRSGARTVKASTCRLVEISAGSETVIASKADEMTKKIEEILGLTVEDFTRAVVLPQGKFAEFLTIKPKDRRLMLERLFSLETYGRDLTARLAEQLDNTKFTLNGVEQRQQGLGDASGLRVKEAEEEFASATRKMDLVAQNLQKIRQDYEQAQELWNLQQQLQQITVKEKELEAERPEVDQLVERLSLAERAELIRPFLEEIRMAEERFIDTGHQVETATQRLRAARLETDTLIEKWSEENQKRTDVEPRCLRRLEQLNQAVNLEEDIQIREVRLKAARLNYVEKDRGFKELEHVIQGLSEKKAARQKQQLALKDKLTQCYVDPLQRARVNAAAQALEALEIVSQQTEGLKRDLASNSTELKEWQQTSQSYLSEAETIQGLLEKLAETLKLRQQNPPVGEDNLSVRVQDLERYRHRLANIERAEQERVQEYERLQISWTDCQIAQDQVLRWENDQTELSPKILEARSWLETKSLELKELEQKNLAGILVEGLVPGEACPVCGALDHPLPAPDIDKTVLDKARNDVEQASLELQTLEGRLTQGATALAVAKAQWSAKQELVENQSALVKAKERATFLVREELRESDKVKPLHELKSKLAGEETRLSEDRLALSRWKTELEQETCKLEEAQSELAEVNKKSQSAAAQLASLEGVRREIQNRLTMSLQEQRERNEHLDELREEIGISEIAALQQRHSSWDQAARRLNQELAVLEDEWGVLDQEHQRLTQQKNHVELELQNLKTVGSEAARELQDIKDKWESLTAGRPARELMEQVKAELALVITTEQELKLRYEQAKELLTQAEQSLAVSRKTWELARERLADVQQKLAQGLLLAQFESAEAARCRLCDITLRQKMQQDISTYQQEVQVYKQRCAALEKQLKGNSLRPEEWLAWPIRLKEAEKLYYEAVERKGVTQQTLSELRGKHEEWVSLDSERKKLGRLLNLYKALQTVLKGNAFVEFIAQEQLTSVAIAASERLKELTNQRYALEVDSEGGFIMRDDANGGVRRPVNSLSGGETFLTALSLALSLSTQIQLKGQSPLEFFFLDEGFGTLDANLLETVMNTLEKLRLQNLMIGIISHVPELKNRLARRLIVTPAEAGGAGSKVKLEMA